LEQDAIFWAISIKKIKEAGSAPDNPASFLV
jgi:hypothetical protein